MSDVCVVGAGVSGLTVAHRLAKRGRSVVVLERSGRPGGVIRSTRTGSLLAESGPNSAMASAEALGRLVGELGLDAERVSADPASARRYILRDGGLHPVPTSPPGLLRSGLLSTRGKLRVLREPFIRRAPQDANESVGSFVRRRLGSELLDYGINPFVAGVFAGDPDLLEFRSAFPRMKEIEDRFGSLIRGQIGLARERRRSGVPRPASGMFSFRDGMQTLTDALARTVDLTTGVTVTRIAHAAGGYRVEGTGPDGGVGLDVRSVVVAADADATRSLLSEIAPELDAPLREIPYPPVSIVVSEYRREDVDHPLDGFGVLVPARERRRVLGTVFTSSLFPHRAAPGHVVMTTFVGGMRQPAEARLPDDALRGLVADELADLVGARSPLTQTVTRHERAIPQYTLGHAARMAQIERTETANPGLVLAANYRGGISVGDCVTSGEATADAVDAFLARSPGD